MKCLLYLLDYDFIIIEQTRFFTKGPFPMNRINKNLLQKSYVTSTEWLL